MSAPNDSRASPSQQHPSPRSLRRGLKRAAWTVLHHIRKHAGVGVVCAVAYFDPGNWGVDLQAGSLYGYRLLFVVLMAGIFAVFLQVLASRLGCVTGLDLASHTRLLLYNRPKHTLLYRWLGLYPLYVLAEVAIIATDLAEMLGSAIALSLLFPKLQLWHGVLLTATDVILILAIGDPLRGRPVRMFEFLIAGLVLAVLICMGILISKVDVKWADVFVGYLPSKYVFASGSLYTSIGIIGATVMPHSLFIGSALATQDRLNYRPCEEKLYLHTTESLDMETTKETFRWRWLKIAQATVRNAFRVPPASLYSTKATNHAEHENNPFQFVKAHIYHGIADVVASLLGFAVVINSLILILASAVFYYGTRNASEDGRDPASLFDAYNLLRDLIGQPAATLFAVALLASGQSSSFIATIAGQAVAEGFLQWRMSPVLRRLATRLLAIIPSMVVAIAIGKKGIDTLLVASQVILSIILPFITFPLLYCTSSKAIMSVRKSTSAEGQPPSPNSGTPAQVESGDDEWLDYSNGKITIFIGCAIWLVIVSANVYVLVKLAMGD